MRTFTILSNIFTLQGLLFCPVLSAKPGANLKTTKPYHIESARRMASNYDSTAITGSEAIITTRILPRFQTFQERNFCGRKITHESHPPALLRTYYGDVNGQDQDEAHKVMIGNAILNNLVDKDGTWNDKALYDFGDDWQRLLLRVPELCDQERHSSVEDYRESEHEEDIEAPPAGDREALERWLWSRNVAIRLYVTDREAMESGKIKVFYLDTHGDAIWHHKFSADNLLEYNGAWNSMGLAEINACFSSSQENGCELFI